MMDVCLGFWVTFGSLVFHHLLTTSIDCRFRFDPIEILTNKPKYIENSNKIFLKKIFFLLLFFFISINQSINQFC